ncbi:hypothetical protein Ancab_019740 [Ancistrocladus abbreviatus]
MFGCGKCIYWNNIVDLSPPELKTFILPSPIPEWPKGKAFATGRIILGELEVAEITSFEFIWASNLSNGKRKGVSFYRPVDIPDGFFSFGHYCQWSGKPLLGFVLVARELAYSEYGAAEPICSPALLKPVDYTLVWCSNDGNEETYGQPGYFWLPQPPDGYDALGFVVTNHPNKPDLEEVRCVRADLTDCYPVIEECWEEVSTVGTFFCSSIWGVGEELHVKCLKNSDPSFHAMPILEQIHALIHHYGPTGALLFRVGELTGEDIDATGSNLPGGGTNDSEFWIDLPGGDQREIIERGDLESAELYVHVKPALGGTFTDIAMWVFCPFNGPATLKVGPANFPFKRIGQHVGDWEHFTLRISNFTGELHSIYFSQHSGGQWVNACDLEYIEGNRAVVYSSKSGHASFPHPGTYLQGSEKLGIGIRNDCARSNFLVDSSVRYQIVAAEYLEGEVV